ncbi:MAG: flagellar biosynthesis protein FlhF [Leptospiraceae bacterium]|nr:flagellar biosynthesis protein FlhF [Leptospiraceae bacterium]MCK6380404.1 flagellar biosynthesis protein FlhF [Leptospiraceae bacterium]NUM41559.1 flagellar biosynthesis protein FlhF [Leptospiraceae bacterium]
MDFVKIRGKSIQDCFMQMKMKYGPEAHVYDQRVVTEGGVLGSGFLAKKLYEIEIGIPEKLSSKDKVEKKVQDLKELLRQKTDEAKKAKPLSELKTLSDKLDDIPKEEKITSILVEKEKEELIKPERKNLGLSLHEEIEKRNDSKFTIKESLSTNLIRLRERLITEGMSSFYASELMDRLEENLSLIEKSKSSLVNEKCVEVLRERISVDSDLFAGTPRNRRKIIFFVGPTGSGKTTTIAKLAARYYLNMRKAVSLYTLDNYRIAAIEQLKRYADTMELPFYAAKDPEKMKEALLRDGSELILIDTAGHSHRNPEFFSKMKEFSGVFSERDSVENILVISATSSYSNAKSVFSAYESLNYNRILVTKTDEADFLCSFVELADTLNKRFTFFSTGQDVPFDITSADRKLLAEIVVYPEKIRELKGEVFAVAG